MEIERYSRTHGQRTIIIDDEDADILSKWNLYVIYHPTGGEYLARLYKTTGFKQTQCYLHRMILDCKKGDVVKFLNGNTLDCRRSNIIKQTYAEKMSHVRKFYSRVYKNENKK